jgi:Tol biopolymer transport system component
MNADGASLHRIATAGRNPDWSPDGAHLAFDASGNIMVADASGTNARVLAANGVAPAWSPDGTRVAFERQKTIVVVGVDGSGERLVAADAGQPDWSPDGTRLVVTKRSSRGLAIASIDGTGLQSLTADYDSQPAWSPDGRWIAYVHCWGPHRECEFTRPDGGEPGDATVIGIIAPDGSGRRELPMGTDPEETDDRAPSWSPDAHDLAFARVTDDSHIFVFRGLRVARRLTRPPALRTFVFARARTGRTIMRAERQGMVVALAVNRGVTAAIVRDGAVWRLEVLSPRRRDLVLPRRPGPELGASGRTLVYRVARSIFAVHAARGRPRRIATAASTPIGLSVVNRRVAWAENHGGKARVRGLTLGPGSAR